tara:strand:+ start:48 stop:167 length:120 start_codon:yes stop_codon:yes gene_type:complete
MSFEPAENGKMIYLMMVYSGFLEGELTEEETQKVLEMIA